MAVANFKNTDILIIDEVSMLHPAFLDRLHEVACALNRTPAPMGGIQLVLVGDLYQLPCVSKGPELFCFHAKHWPLLVPRIFHLEKVFRQTDHELINVLNDIRVGNITQHVLDYLSSIPSDVPDESQYTFIYPRLHQVAEHNSRRLSELPGAESNYKARLIDTTPGEFQNKRQFGPATFPKDTVIPEELVVKPGALVMLIVNIDVAKGLINGTQGLVLSCSPSIVSVVFAIQPTAPLSYPPSNTWDPLCYTILNLTRNRFVISRWLTVEQFPITLAFALTVHKAQGSSLAKVCVDIGDSVFATGQAYVALSRCICPELLRIKSFHPDSIKASTAVCEFYSKSAPPPATAAAVVSQDDPAENEQEEASL
jgi:ATP-dependent DNA helicase PIF1